MDGLSSHTAIDAEGLQKRFRSVVALDGVDLSVPAGSIFGLLGPNGAGKTTVVRILTTILRSDAGRASVHGLDVAAHPQRVRALIGLAGQYAAVDENLTGHENLRLVGRLTHQAVDVVHRRADELLELFRLADAGARPVRTYSGGMRRRLDLAAALVHRPPVLFLDEPTTGLDPHSRLDLWTMIEGLVSEGTTVLLTTQYLEEADRLARDMAVIDHGRVIARGSAASLKAEHGSTVAEVELPDAHAAARGLDELRAIGDAVIAPTNPTTIRIKVDDATKAMMSIVRRLDAVGIEPTRLTVHEPTLDDVFISLTGRTAETTEAEADEPAATDARRKPSRRGRS